MLFLDESNRFDIGCNQKFTSQCRNSLNPYGILRLAIVQSLWWPQCTFQDGFLDLISQDSQQNKFSDVWLLTGTFMEYTPIISNKIWSGFSELKLNEVENCLTNKSEEEPPPICWPAWIIGIYSISVLERSHYIDLIPQVNHWTEKLSLLPSKLDLKAIIPFPGNLVVPHTGSIIEAVWAVLWQGTANMLLLAIGCVSVVNLSTVRGLITLTNQNGQSQFPFRSIMAYAAFIRMEHRPLYFSIGKVNVPTNFFSWSQVEKSGIYDIQIWPFWLESYKCWVGGMFLKPNSEVSLWGHPQILHSYLP